MKLLFFFFFLIGGNVEGLGYYAPSLCVLFFSELEHAWSSPDGMSARKKNENLELGQVRKGLWSGDPLVMEDTLLYIYICGRTEQILHLVL